jgi:hypothetical protein
VRPQPFFGHAGRNQDRLELLVEAIAERRAAGWREKIREEQFVSKLLDHLHIVQEVQPDHLGMQRNVALGLNILDPSAFVFGNVQIRNVAVVDDHIIDHQAAELFTAATRVIDEDRHVIERAVKDMSSAREPRLSERVPIRAIVERRRAEDCHGTLDRQLEPFVPAALFPLAFGAELREIDLVEVIQAASAAMIEDLTDEGKMPVDGSATETALAFFALLPLFVELAPLLAELLNRQMLIPDGFAVMLVDLEKKEISKVADMRLAAAGSDRRPAGPRS